MNTDQYLPLQFPVSTRPILGEFFQNSVGGATTHPLLLSSKPRRHIHWRLTMLDSIVFLVFFLPCAGMSAVFTFYMFFLCWYASTHHPHVTLPVNSLPGKGLSPSELEKLPKVPGKELVMGTECAVCLDDIENEQPARVVPGCNHGFHVECADTWLSRHPQCPVCRAKLDPQLLNSSENP